MDPKPVSNWLAIIGVTLVALALIFKEQFSMALTAVAIIAPGMVPPRQSAAPVAVGEVNVTK